MIGSAATIAGRERESVPATFPHKAQTKFSVMALRTITRFSSLQHVPLSLDCLIDDTYSSRDVPSERFRTTSGGLSCGPNSRACKSAIFMSVGTRPVSASFQSVSHRGVVVGLFVFHQANTAWPSPHLPSKAPGESLVRCSHTPTLFTSVLSTVFLH